MVILGNFFVFEINRLVQKGLTEISPVLLTVENLKGLDLTQNKISAVPGFVAKLQYLRFLHLGDNQIADFPLEIILKMPLLAGLDLSKNRITCLWPTVTPEQLTVMRGSLAQLRELNISRNRLLKAPDCLGAFASLSSLNVSYNQ
jgi:Leucine-rich repeat (LRR) protein